VIGKVKDVLFPSPRLDFYAVIQARKRKDSPHGKNGDVDRQYQDNEIEGKKYQPTVLFDENLGLDTLIPYH
jgi:hypothetical protein